jgi:uncharacterized protein YcbK (DUF882 family)
MTALKDTISSQRTELSRRRLMQLIFLAGLTILAPPSLLASIKALNTTKRSLSLYNPHTKESFAGIYRLNGEYDSHALAKINHLMRDTRTGEVKEIDKQLLDLMYALAEKLKAEEPFHVISGYRNPKSNAQLMKQGRNAARNSYHVKGQAADIRLPGNRTSMLRRAAYQIKKGGVGYYPHLRFVHIDVGPIRYWNGKKS